MGTRSLTVMQEADGTEIAVLYRQFDGYPTGHGAELADFLKGNKVVNGITMGQDHAKTHNGASCLAAQLVSHFKSGIGDFYLYPAGTRDAGEEYRYYVRPEDEIRGIGDPEGVGIHLKVESVGWNSAPDTVLYEGPIDDFDPEAAEKQEAD